METERSCRPSAAMEGRAVPVKRIEDPHEGCCLTHAAQGSTACIARRGCKDPKRAQGTQGHKQHHDAQGCSAQHLSSGPARVPDLGIVGHVTRRTKLALPCSRLASQLAASADRVALEVAPDPRAHREPWALAWRPRPSTPATSRRATS
eukprot:scaffold2275_cov245-Pinguiococcus_pyrenoidosus.AAC.11